MFVRCLIGFMSLFHFYIGSSQAFLPKPNQAEALVLRTGSGRLSDTLNQNGPDVFCGQDSRTGGSLQRILKFIKQSTTSLSEHSLDEDNQLQSTAQPWVTSDAKNVILHDTDHGYGNEKNHIPTHSSYHPQHLPAQRSMREHMNKGSGKDTDWSEEPGKADAEEDVNPSARRAQKRRKESGAVMEPLVLRPSLRAEQHSKGDNSWGSAHNDHLPSEVDLSSFWDFMKDYLKKKVLKTSGDEFVVQKSAKKILGSYNASLTRYSTELKQAYQRNLLLEKLFSLLGHKHVESLNLYQEHQKYIRTLENRLKHLIIRTKDNDKDVDRQMTINWVEELNLRVLLLVRIIKNIIHKKGINPEDDFQTTQNQLWKFLKAFWECSPLFDTGDCQKIYRLSITTKIHTMYGQLIATPNKRGWHKVDMTASWHLVEAWMSQEPKERKLWNCLVSKKDDIITVLKNFVHDIVLFYFSGKEGIGSQTSKNISPIVN